VHDPAVSTASCWQINELGGPSGSGELLRPTNGLDFVRGRESLDDQGCGLKVGLARACLATAPTPTPPEQSCPPRIASQTLVAGNAPKNPTEVNPLFEPVGEELESTFLP